MNIKIPKYRRVIGYGYSKLVVLPKFWVDHHELSRGDEVSMEVNEYGILLVRPAKKNETKKTS